MNNSIYSDLFDITKANIEAAGSSFTVSKAAYLEMSCKVPGRADILELTKEKDNRLFLEKAYVVLMERYADDGALVAWEKNVKRLPVEEFQRVCVQALMNSPEFAGKNVDAYNNIYSTHNIYSTNNVQNSVLNSSDTPPNVEGRSKIYILLRKIYHKFPEGLKKLCRKILRKM